MDSVSKLNYIFRYLIQLHKYRLPCLTLETFLKMMMLKVYREAFSSYSLEIGHYHGYRLIAMDKTKLVNNFTKRSFNTT